MELIFVIYSRLKQITLKSARCTYLLYPFPTFNCLAFNGENRKIKVILTSECAHDYYLSQFDCTHPTPACPYELVSFKNASGHNENIHPPYKVLGLMRYKVNRDEFDIYPETWLHLDYRPTAATVSGFRSKQQNSHRMPVRCLICLSWSNTWTGTYRAFMNIKSGKLFSFFFWYPHVPYSSAY